MANDKNKIRKGPGVLYTAPVGSDIPSGATALSDSWSTIDPAWTELGFTDEGSEFTFDVTFEDIMVAERLDPVLIEQTARAVSVNFALVEVTAENLEFVFNGGTVTTGTGYKSFEPPALGDATEVMIGWESDSGAERWVFKQCLQTGSISMARRKAPDKATLPCEFRCLVPEDDSSLFKVFISDTVAH